MADAGWYPDPLGHAEYRYFDGEHWTDQVSSGGTVRTDPPVEATKLTPAEDHPPPPATPTPEAPAAKRPVWWLVAGAAVLVALVVAAAILLTGGDDGDGDDAASSEDTEEESTTTTEPTTTTTEPTTTTTEDGGSGLTPEDEAACRYLLEQIDAPGGYDPNVVFPTVVDLATDGGEVEAAAGRALTSYQQEGQVSSTAAAELVVACSSVL
jgi:hypothetical protein